MSCILKWNVNFKLSQVKAMFVFLASHRNGFINSCLSFEDLLAYRIWWIHVDWCNFRIHLRGLKIPPSPYSEALSKKIMIQIKLVGMSIIFHCTKLRLSKWNGSWVVSIKQNVNFKFQLHTVFTFMVSCKICLIKICQQTKFHGPMFTGASFAATTEVWKSHHRHIQKLHNRKY
jgi:hypothetical protein